MATNPNFVRLARRLTHGMVADLDSGWSIAGLDVRKFPSDDKAARKFVKKALADGRLEVASQVEWDEVHDTDDFQDEAHNTRATPPTVGMQEAQIRRKADERRAAIEESRTAAEAEADAEDDEDDSDDDDEDEEPVAPAPKKKSTSSKAKAKKKK